MQTQAQKKVEANPGAERKNYQELLSAIRDEDMSALPRAGTNKRRVLLEVVRSPGQKLEGYVDLIPEIDKAAISSALAGLKSEDWVCAIKADSHKKQHLHYRLNPKRVRHAAFNPVQVKGSEGQAPEAPVTENPVQKQAIEAARMMVAGSR